MIKSSIRFLFMSSFFSFLLQVANKSHNSAKMTSVWTLHPPSYHRRHPHLQSQSSDHQPCVRPALLSRGANLHYGDELCNCVDSTAGLLQERAGLSLDMGIMQWPGFRGHFTHCLKSISRNASLVDFPPLLCWGPTHSPTKHQCAEPHASFSLYSIWTKALL